MLIILEGADLAGKSTLAQRLVTKLAANSPNARVELLHRGPPTSHPYHEYAIPLFSYYPNTGHHIVCDRWHIGETIYPALLNRSSQLDDANLKRIETFLKRRGALLVHVAQPFAVLAARLDARGDTMITKAHLRRLVDAYGLAVNRSLLPTTTNLDPLMIIKRAETLERAVVTTVKEQPWN